MSGLEVVGVFGVVAGIISAFHDSLSLYRSWKQKKKERRRNSKNESLEQSLSLGETKIQQEYDLHFARLGQRFAVGDYQGRAELNQYVVTLLHTIVTLMANSTSSHQIVLPKLPIMLSTSENTRTGVLSSMGSQYQRLLQTVPLSSWNMSYQGNGTDGAQETLNGKLEELHISARSDAFGSSGIGANIGSPSKTTFPRAPRIVDLRLEKGNAKEKISEPKLEAPACISQANNEVSGKASKPVVAAPSNKPSTTDVATSSTAVEKAKFPPCGEALAWEISDGQPRYKCSKCDFNIKLETMQSYFLEFRTKDGFKIRVDNKDIWDSHAKCYTPKVPLCVCKLCQNSVYFLVSLKDHFKTHTKEEVLLSYPGAHVLK